MKHDKTKLPLKSANNKVKEIRYRYKLSIILDPSRKASADEQIRIDK